MASPSAATAEQFSTAEQQRESAFLGMWAFLATEIMLFGGLFMAIAVYRLLHPDAVREASAHLYKSLGGINTAVLLASSLAVALAVLAARDGRRSHAVTDLLIATGLGVAFLGIKGFEYYLDYREGLMPGVGPRPFPLPSPASELFINAYFFATGIHALHVLIGVVVLGALAWRLATGLSLPGRSILIEIGGLYWHFVDIVWIFLYPVLYLAGG